VEVVDIAKQHFGHIPEAVIDALIDKGDVLYSAGGFTVEDPLLAPFLGERVGTEDSSKFCRSCIHRSTLQKTSQRLNCFFESFRSLHQSWGSPLNR
jgi:hypothetical protein